MNVSEFIVKYMKTYGLKHFFGYQGTMIAYFVDAIGNEEGVFNHSFYNEQGAALAACGYSKSSGDLSCAYSTSGPGAINLIQGIADAYYDSAPVVFITGQLNKKEYTNVPSLRQQGFQETNIIDITRSITKYSRFIDTPESIVDELPKAMKIALSGRRGPVLLDIPMDIQRSVINFQDENFENFVNFGESTRDTTTDVSKIAKYIVESIEESNRPVFLIGNGIHRDINTRRLLMNVIRKISIPVLSGLMSKDMIPEDGGSYFGFVGASYGQRSANIIANKKADLIISLGCRLSTRLTGVKQDQFAREAKIIRVEIDENEIKKKIHDNEESFLVDVNKLLVEMSKFNVSKSFDEWMSVCKEIKKLTTDFDNTCTTRYPNKFVSKVSDKYTKPLIAVSDVGQSMMWVANSFNLREGQELLFSGAHGAMGFALPAAIGAYYANDKTILCFSGDGGFQMNIQELQYVFREKLPIKIFVFNNNALGMITQVQDDYLGGRRTGTDPSGGFTSPDFSEIAHAFHISSFSVDKLDTFDNVLEAAAAIDGPVLVQINFYEQTYSHPKTFFGDEISNQRPYLPKEVYSKIMDL